MVFCERVRITEYWKFCLIALGFGALGRCHSSRELRQEGSRKALKPLNLGSPQNEQSWGSALPQLNSVILILKYQFIGQTGAAFPFVQQQRLLSSGSPGLIPIPGAVSNFWGGMTAGEGWDGGFRAEILKFPFLNVPFPHRCCPQHGWAAGLPAPRALRQLPGPWLAGTCLLGEVNDKKKQKIPFPPHSGFPPRLGFPAHGAGKANMNCPTPNPTGDPEQFTAQPKKSKQTPAGTGRRWLSCLRMSCLLDEGAQKGEALDVIFNFFIFCRTG